ncbi:MAG: Uma2 family endonuclease [Candidatus Binatia bacterium]
MAQTAIMTSPQQEKVSPALLSDEAFEQLYDLVSLCGKRPIFTVAGELELVLAPGGAHSGLVQGVTNALLDRVQDVPSQRYWVYQERNIRLSAHENPIVPDIAVYDRELRYTESSPIIIPLVAIEVGLATTQHDHAIKAPRYAQAGVGELWLITMPDLARYPLATGYVLDPHNRTYQVASHNIVSPRYGLSLHTISLRIEGEQLRRSLHRYGIPLAELADWPELPTARSLEDRRA